MTYMLDVSKKKKKTCIVDIYHYIIEINTSNSWDRYTLSY